MMGRASGTVVQCVSVYACVEFLAHESFIMCARRTGEASVLLGQLDSGRLEPVRYVRHNAHDLVVIVCALGDVDSHASDDALSDALLILPQLFELVRVRAVLPVLLDDVRSSIGVFDEWRTDPLDRWLGRKRKRKFQRGRREEEGVGERLRLDERVRALVDFGAKEFPRVVGRRDVESEWRTRIELSDGLPAAFDKVVVRGDLAPEVEAG